MYFLIFLFLIFIVGLIWFLSPTPASQSEIKEFLIYPEVSSHFKSFRDLEIHYDQVGKGRDIVLLHGIGASTFIWRSLMPLLARNFRVTAIDLPGHGRSEKNLKFNYDLENVSVYLLDFIDSIVIKDYMLIGSSMGALIALWMLKTRPKNISEVICISPPTDHSLIKFYRPLLPLLLPLHFFINRISMKVAVHRAINRSELVTRDVVNAYMLPFRDRGEAWQCFLKSVNILAHPEIPEALKHLNKNDKLRLKIIHGLSDKVVPKSIPLELKKMLPNAEIEFIENAGHHAFEDHPELIYESILKFVNPKEEK